MENGDLTVVDENSTTPTISQDQFDMVDVEGASAYMDNYQELVEALLNETDYQKIGGKNAKKKSAWRKLATAFKISDDIVTEQLTFDENDGQIVSARYKVRATLPNGRSTIGVGVCSIYDKIRYSGTAKNPADTETPSNFVLRGRFSHAEHDVPSTAHTRAKNRAIADLIGAGEVSAEELGDYEEPKKVSRRTKNGNSKPEETTSKSRPANRRRSRKKAEEKVEEEIIETKAEVVEETDDFEGYAEKNPALAKAIQRIRDGGDELTKNSIVEELYAIYDLGHITIDEYYEAKEVLGL
jgi:hypothetical protein